MFIFDIVKDFTFLGKLLAMLFIKRFFIPLFALLIGVAAFAQEEYNPEIGYFQKAHRDDGDPRYMITDGSGFSLGIGGRVLASSYFDFDGALDGYCFSPSSIAVPTDHTNNFGYTITGSSVYVKARAENSKHKLIAYLELGGVESGKTDMVLLSKAYVSVNGLSIGKTYSFFMDLAAGPMTVDLQGPNTQIAKTHNLIGYQKRLGNFTLGLSLEDPTTINYKDDDINADYNRIPDGVLFAKYRGEKGHVQVGFLGRELNYWVSKTGFAVAADGLTKRAKGFGVSLSGNFNPSKKLSFSASSVFGKGIGGYIQDLDGTYASLGKCKQYDDDGYPVLKPITAYGGYLSASYKWSDKSQSSVVYGLCMMDKGDLITATDFLSSQYAAINYVYFISAHCFAGVEYLYGRKNITTTASDSYGYANRFAASLCYRF